MLVLAGLCLANAMCVLSGTQTPALVESTEDGHDKSRQRLSVMTVTAENRLEYGSRRLRWKTAAIKCMNSVGG